MSESTFSIGQAAARAGVSADTIRYYERVGVLPRPPRTAAGYRRYTDASVGRIILLRAAARLGFPLAEIGGFLKARAQGQPPCHGVRAAGARLLAEMDRQLAELHNARAAMAATLSEWDRRLARTPAGSAAHLLESLVGAPARHADKQGHAGVS